MTNQRPSLQADKLLHDFNAALGLNFDAPSDLLAAAEAAIGGCSPWPMHSQGERDQRLIALINSKLKLNRSSFQSFLDGAARERVFLNYHDKAELAECLDRSDQHRLKRWISESGYDARLINLFAPITKQETLAGLSDLLSTGKVNRSDARQCDLTERQSAILRALFGSYVFEAFPPQAMHSYFNSDAKVTYRPDFYQHLLDFHSTALHRDCALVYLSVDQSMIDNNAPEQLRDTLYTFISKTYDRLANHCYFAVKIKPFREGSEDGQWKLFSDLVLYAEKHRESRPQNGYFRPRDIEAATNEHIPDVHLADAKFDIANEGFFFRDCFVLSSSPLQGGRGQATTSEDVDLLVLFEKNERDERVIPCPACRSFDVRGNSYPSLGVRSWECQNPICPDRSAFDRGNRYSLSAIIKQEAIKSECDEIPEDSLRRWKLDVVFGVDDNAIVDMLIRHFTLHGDTAVLVNNSTNAKERYGRLIVHESLDKAASVPGVHRAFQESAFFKRYIVDRQEPNEVALVKVAHRASDVAVYHGNCFEVLSCLKSGSIDGAITSPPYYNARSYTTWPNIYCYLYDMYNAARAVFRVLAPGSVYLFNIFDYFDNENSIALSAMGKKRMILGAYIVDIFRRAGFELQANVVWYKGEIEGKRNFNQGNRSPYYQFPFNCWEHCFVFRKPATSTSVYSFPTILDAKPVIKMIRGKNVLGHTAPFPPAIPRLLISQMKKGQCVLDPFSGSMTTGRIAHKEGLRSISIEMHREYCDLGIKLMDEEDQNSSDLFLQAG